MTSTKSSYLQVRLTPREKQSIQRAAKKAGMDMSAWILARVFVPGEKRFAACLEALQRDQNDHHQRRYAFAAIDDLFESLTKDEFVRTVATAPGAALKPFAANYLAAMVEMTCHRKNVPAPAWAADIAPLNHPYFATQLQGMRLHLLLSSPPPFRRRNIFVDTGTGERL